MDTRTVIAATVVGALAGIPIAALAYATTAQNSVHIPERWWRGSPAPWPLATATVLLCGVVTAGITARVPITVAVPAFWFFGNLGICLAIIDVRHHRLPHVLTGGMTAVSLLCFTSATVINGNMSPLLRAILASLVAASLLLTIALTFPGQLGLGDVALAGAMMLNLGWLSLATAVSGLLIGLAIQAVIGMVARARKPRIGAIAMGPAFIVGWFIALMLADL